MNYTPNFGWYYVSAEDRAPAWSSVEYFFEFLTGAPRFAEQNGGEGFCSVAEWPEYDEAKTVDSTVEYAVQVLGKLRGTVIVNANDDKDTVLAKAKAVDKVVPFLEGKTIVKEIFVPNKLVNFVVK